MRAIDEIDAESLRDEIDSDHGLLLLALDRTSRHSLGEQRWYLNRSRRGGLQLVLQRWGDDLGNGVLQPGPTIWFRGDELGDIAEAIGQAAKIVEALQS